MKLYAASPGRRARQVTGDLLLAGWVLLWLWLANVVHDATLALAAPARQVQDAGEGLAGRLRDAGGAAGDLPLVGEQVRSPLEGAGRAADQMAGAGASTVAAVEELAFWVAVAVAVMPVLLALAIHLPGRWRFVREATAAQRFIDTSPDLDLFALRAMAHQPMHRLAAVTHDPVGAWRSGDATVIDALARLELRDAGLPTPARVAGDGRGRAPA